MRWPSLVQGDLYWVWICTTLEHSIYTYILKDNTNERTLLFIMLCPKTKESEKELKNYSNFARMWQSHILNDSIEEIGTCLTQWSLRNRGYFELTENVRGLSKNQSKTVAAWRSGIDIHFHFKGVWSYYGNFQLHKHLWAAGWVPRLSLLVNNRKKSRSRLSFQVSGSKMRCKNSETSSWNEHSLFLSLSDHIHPPQLCPLSNPRMVSIFWAHSSITVHHVSTLQGNNVRIDRNMSESTRDKWQKIVQSDIKLTEYVRIDSNLSKVT